ncbi:protein rep [Peribacillus frigoritolerans]|uniref:protein rep n=1 Tax=Peribacillus frigoritolerans TaxID=450367 RepID=UPI001DBD7607|nr:replication protein [Listeria monocytogenes]
MDKYTPKKNKNQALVPLIHSFLSESGLELIKECSTFMTFIADEMLDKKKQHKGNSCKNRFCPICSWKKSRKDALALSLLMEYIKVEHEKDFIFLTLTAPNVSADKVNDEIKKFNHSFKKLFERKEVKQVTKGYVRKLEVTYNNERFITEKMYSKRIAYYKKRNLHIGDNNPNYNTYHPHFHVMIAVNKSYFNKADLYLSRDKWLELWQEATGDYSITQVDVRKVRHNSKKEVAEVTKYSAKDSDYLQSPEVFETFYKALKGKRLIVYSGLFKDAMKLFKTGELDKYKDVDSTEYVYELLYTWGKSDYVLKEKRLLTDEQKKELNKQLINEIETE